MSVIELARCLGEADPSARMKALEAAARADLDGVADLVLEKARRERHPRLRAAMLYLVGRSGEAEHVPAVAKFLKDPEPKVRVRAAEALARIGDPSAYPALVRCMGGDEDDRVRSLAAHFLLKLGTQKLLALFAGMIRSEKAWKRQAAVLACQKFNSPLVIPLLAFAAINDDEGNRKLARSGLERLAALGNQSAAKALRDLPDARGSAEDLSRVSQELEEVISSGHDDMNQTYTGAPVELSKAVAADEPFGQVDAGRASPSVEAAIPPGLEAGPAGAETDAAAGTDAGTDAADPDAADPDAALDDDEDDEVEEPPPAAAEAKKKCPLCGSQCAASLSKCPRCGTPLDRSIEALMGKAKPKPGAEPAPGTRPWVGTALRVLLGLVLLGLNSWVAYECWQSVAGGPGRARVDGDEMSMLTRKLKQMVGFVVGGISLGGVFTGFLTMFQVRGGFVYVIMFRISWIVYLLIGLLVQEPRLIGVSLAVLGTGALLSVVNRKFP